MASQLIRKEDEIMRALTGKTSRYSAHSAAHKDWDRYKSMVRAAVSGKVPQKVVDELENENYHTMVQALTELGLVQR